MAALRSKLISNGSGASFPAATIPKLSLSGKAVSVRSASFFALSISVLPSGAALIEAETSMMKTCAVGPFCVLPGVFTLSGCVYGRAIISASRAISRQRSSRRRNCLSLRCADSFYLKAPRNILPKKHALRHAAGL
jgi:hypothetical protein